MDFWSSVSKWFSEKTSSTMYFAYLVLFITWNWAFFQIIFLESSSVFYYPRIEYIFSNIFFDLPWLAIILPNWAYVSVVWVANLIWRVVPPAVFTVLAILWLPPVNRWFLKKELKHRFNRKRDFVEAREEYEEWELERERERAKRLEALANVRAQQTTYQRQIRERETKGLSPKSRLTEPQVESILALLASFGASTKTIEDVEDALRG